MRILILATAALLLCGNAAAGDPAKGAIVFHRCAQCHNADEGGGNGLGPNLFGVVGRKAASLPDFYYSEALKKSGIVWTNAKLAKWVQGPQKVVPGTRMVFPGLTKKQDIDDLVAFLNTKK